MITKNIELNAEFKKALQLMEEETNIFITGRAGTGKSTLLEYFRDITNKKIAVLAFTGVAALNVEGQTIHSFFRFGPNIRTEDIGRKRWSKEKEELIKNLETIILDEVSMVRADLLDCVDLALKKIRRNKEAFGGVQMIFVGDLCQIEPVVMREEKEFFRTNYKSPYFFDSQVLLQENFFKPVMKFIELRKIYRQKDNKFIDLLNKVRDDKMTREDLSLLNTRHDENFNIIDNENYILLTTKNARAKEINAQALQRLDEEESVYEADTDGDFKEKLFPTEQALKIKRGAKVMMLTNDKEGNWVNGSIGEITDIKKQKVGADIVEIKLTNDKEINITPHKWEIYAYSFDEGEKKINTEVIGTFEQYPFKLAWAITIHKSQGKTFDNVVIDMENGAFSHGQTYVALSRCTSFEGVVLRRPISSSDIWVNSRISDFLNNHLETESPSD